jgi:glycosyltransferase involved in cell wall biosynthesis
VAGPLVSVIVPAWRPRADWLRTAVESAVGQRGVDVEVVVVDDGSPEPVAPALEGVDGRVRTIRVPHGGVARARNAGLVAAAGRVVRFLDADDALEAGSTARLLRLLDGRDDVIAYGATVMCEESLAPRRTVASTLEGDVLRAAVLGRFDVRIVSLLFPRRVVDLAGPFDPSLPRAEDGDFVLRALEHAEVRGETLPASFYRRHGASATADVAAGEAGLLGMLDRYFERHPEERGTALERRARASVYLAVARGYRAHGRRREAVDRALRALTRDPRRTVPALARGLR